MKMVKDLNKNNDEKLMKNKILISQKLTQENLEKKLMVSKKNRE